MSDTNQRTRYQVFTPIEGTRGQGGHVTSTALTFDQLEDAIAAADQAGQGAYVREETAEIVYRVGDPMECA